MQTVTEETPAGMEAILPPRCSHQAVYTQKLTDPQWLEFFARIPLHARGEFSTLLAAAYFWLLRIECDLADRWPRLDTVLGSTGRRSRNLLKWAYRRIT